ncbi:hypothetical protein LUZ60_015396 [Juncus effusus]|nr:hypothetical protein LUZ60_015396 [Juncus effusus]
MASVGSNSATIFRALVVNARYNERKQYRRMLRLFNFEVDHVEDGRHAVDLFIDGAEYDFVLIDKMMPLMDGTEATSRIRSMNSEVKIVGLSETEDRMPFLEVGADFFLLKPLEFNNLFMVLIHLGFLH